MTSLLISRPVLLTAVTFLKDHSVNCLADYEANYNAKEGVLAVTLLNLACDMAICITAAHTWFTNHSDQLEACWAQGYEVGEKNLAFDILAEADALVTQHSDVFDCLKACSDEAKMCYTNFYLVEEKATIAEIHDNAQQLADCIVDAHTWLCDQADKHRDRYCDFWVPKENAYVCAVLDKAIELACESKDCLADWCIQQDDKWDWWMNCFQDPEKQTIPKLITAAIDACDKNLDSYQKACDRSDELWDKYMDEWCPCDIIDLNKHCDIWNKVNMLEEICDANACLRTTAEILKECYTDLMLTCEKDYLDFVCNMAYDPKYCDSNTRAVAHTRKNYESQLDLLDQSMPPWCRAAFEDRKIDIKNDQIIAEALSIQVADRWEWLRNVHEDDRKHNYLQDIIRNFGEQWISNSHEMYRSVQQGNDMLLRHVHDRIVRGRLYLDSSFGHLDRTLTALDQTIGNGIQAVNQSHFWPQWYNDGRNAYLQQSNNYLNLADDVIRLGHDTYQMASRDKTTAANLAENAVQAGLAAVDRGHQVKQHALDAASRADQVIQGSVSEGIQTINMGHDLHNMAKASQDSAANTAYQSTQQGLDTVDRGHRVKQMAMDAATSQWQGAHAGIQDGLTSIDLGHFWATHAQNTTEAKINAYHEAWRNTVSHLQHGQRYLSIAAQWGDVANASLRSEIELGNIGLSNALSWFNTAQSKLEAALTAQQSNVGHAVDLLQQGYGRMDSVLGHKNDMQGMIRQSTDGMINMAAEGNRFIYAAADSTVRGAELKKNAITCACDLAMTYYSTMSNQEINLGSAIMGSSYNAAQNALGQINGLANGLSGSIQQIIGPPPTQGLGFNYGTLGNINNGGIVQSGPL